MALEFEQDGRHFRAERLSAKQQFHLSRKIAPILPRLAPLFLRTTELGLFKGEEDLPVAERLAGLLKFIELAEPVAEALAEMKTEDADYVFDVTLGSVKVETAAGTWMPLWNAGAGMAIVEELNDAPALIPIVVQVIQFNLANFISGSLTSRGGPTKASSGERSQAAKIG